MMQQLPLFPLNTIVFPGMPLPLHIFEDRYKEMINDCIDQDAPFGVVLIRQGSAEYDTNVEPFEVGCTVVITQVERLPDGRMFIMTVGQERFRIHSLQRGARAYLMGTVETLPYAPENLGDLAEDVALLRRRVIEYLNLLAELGQIEFEIENLPQEAPALVCMAAALLNSPPEKKQMLLRSNRISALLTYLTPAYDQQIKLLRMLPKEEQSAFSVN